MGSEAWGEVNLVVSKDVVAEKLNQEIAELFYTATWDVHVQPGTEDPEVSGTTETDFVLVTTHMPRWALDRVGALADEVTKLGGLPVIQYPSELSRDTATTTSEPAAG